jgi:hypothetical protein
MGAGGGGDKVSAAEAGGDESSSGDARGTDTAASASAPDAGEPELGAERDEIKDVSRSGEPADDDDRGSEPGDDILLDTVPTSAFANDGSSAIKMPAAEVLAGTAAAAATAAATAAAATAPPPPPPPGAQTASTTMPFFFCAHEFLILEPDDRRIPVLRARVARDAEPGSRVSFGARLTEGAVASASRALAAPSHIIQRLLVATSVLSALCYTTGFAVVPTYWKFNFDDRCMIKLGAH